MAYGAPQASRETPIDTLKKDLPHILVLIGLLLILLVVLTRFKWIHCTQVLKIGPINLPTNWCSFYCENLHGSKSSVAIVSGDGGMGDPAALARRIQQERFYTVPVQISMSEAAYGTLKGYDLVIVERARRITPPQANAILTYLAQGGTVLWIGDSGTEYYYTQEDTAEALRLNQTIPFYYEDFIDQLNVTRAVGFGMLASSLGVKYNSTVNQTSGMTLEKVDRNNLMVADLVDIINMPPVPFTSVSVNPTVASTVSRLRIGTETYPALVEMRNPRLSAVYVAFPLEQSPSKALIANMLDYMVLC